MNKICAFLVAAALFIGCVSFYNSSYGPDDKLISSMYGPLNYYISPEKYNCPEAIGDAMDEKTVLLMGSSELRCTDEVSQPKYIFNDGNSDLNIMEVGRENTQSLWQILALGALEDSVKSKKVVLILSPQWFAKDSLTGEALAARFSERMFAEFISNPRIKRETRKKVVARCQDLLKNYPDQLSVVNKYAKVYTDCSATLLDRLSLDVYDNFSNAKAKNQLAKQIKKDNLKYSGTEETLNYKNIDFASYMQKAAEQGELDCTNNTFYIENKYYDEFIKPKLEKCENASREASYCTSEEYNDLQLYLDVCKEVGVDVMLLSIPVNGYWYDYTAFNHDDLSQYYRNMREIADKNDVKLVDYSSYEYSPYFLKDIMHIGWKGWVYVAQDIVEFYEEAVEE